MTVTCRHSTAGRHAARRQHLGQRGGRDRGRGVERVLLGVALRLASELPRGEHGVAGDDEERHRRDQRQPGGPQQKPHPSTVGNPRAAARTPESDARLPVPESDHGVPDRRTRRVGSQDSPWGIAGLAVVKCGTHPRRVRVCGVRCWSPVRRPTRARARSCAGICRWLHRQGVAVAPFKAQNMSQQLRRHRRRRRDRPRAGDAGARLRPRAERRVQPGAAQARQRPLGPGRRARPGRRHRERALATSERKAALLDVVTASLADLRARFDVVVCEGAGSPAEINLRGDRHRQHGAGAGRRPARRRGRRHRPRRRARAPLRHRRRARPGRPAPHRGLRRSTSSAATRRCSRPGLDQLRALTGRPTLGVVPWAERLWLDAEDSLSAVADGVLGRPAPPRGEPVAAGRGRPAAADLQRHRRRGAGVRARRGRALRHRAVPARRRRPRGAARHPRDRRRPRLAAAHRPRRRGAARTPRPDVRCWASAAATRCSGGASTTRTRVEGGDATRPRPARPGDRLRRRQAPGQPGRDGAGASRCAATRSTTAAWSAPATPTLIDGEGSDDGRRARHPLARPAGERRVPPRAAAGGWPTRRGAPGSRPRRTPSFAAERAAQLDLLGDLVAAHLDTAALEHVIDHGADPDLPVITSGLAVSRVMSTFPFSAVVGLDDLRLALLLNAVHPGVGGVLVRGEKGTAKSTAVRALAALLPAVAVVAGCRFSCDPAAPGPGLPRRAARGTRPWPSRAGAAGRAAGRRDRGPAGRLARPRARAGRGRARLRARAARGRPPRRALRRRGQPAARPPGRPAARRRRDGHARTSSATGVSVSHAARFLLVGTMNPEEGELRPQLLDRFGLTVEVRRGARRRDARRGRAAAARVRRRPGRLRRRVAAAERGDGRAHRRRAGPRSARWRCPTPSCARIAAVCAAFDVDGMRADLVIARAAIAHAAWRGRDGGRARRTCGSRPGWRCRTGAGATRSTSPGVDEQALDDALEQRPRGSRDRPGRPRRARRRTAATARSATARRAATATAPAIATDGPGDAAGATARRQRRRTAGPPRRDPTAAGARRRRHDGRRAPERPTAAPRRRPARRSAPAASSYPASARAPPGGGRGPGPSSAGSCGRPARPPGGPPTCTCPATVAAAAPHQRARGRVRPAPAAARRPAPRRARGPRGQPRAVRRRRLRVDGREGADGRGHRRGAVAAARRLPAPRQGRPDHLPRHGRGAGAAADLAASPAARVAWTACAPAAAPRSPTACCARARCCAVERLRDPRRRAAAGRAHRRPGDRRPRRRARARRLPRRRAPRRRRRGHGRGGLRAGPVRLGLAARLARAAAGELVGIDELSVDRVADVVRAARAA